MTFIEAVHEVELAEVRAACRMLRLSSVETAAVLSWHRRDSSLLGIYHALGGNAVDYVRAKAQCVRVIRARSGLWDW